mgnify:CR=1 FL=1
MPCAGEVNILFFPFKGYHFRACLPKQFPGGAWLKLTLTPEAKPEWGRVWINPSFSLEAFQSFVQQRGFDINCRTALFINAVVRRVRGGSEAGRRAVWTGGLSGELWGGARQLF